MFKVKAAQKGRPKNDVKHSAWIQSFFNFLSSQIKSDDILPEVKLDDVNKHKTNYSKRRTDPLFDGLRQSTYQYVYRRIRKHDGVLFRNFNYILVF